ncbi:DUF6233 domain-containing protein [Streptomyces sp. NRRL S-237]|uniref:DUF6233 domain-containing protein n=1 Tax=Streptomyces sp. NRRL S-237 TaxID=1463895 RepID=UPI0004CB6FA3|nr:DUF6233 domain-containing protein [Streptomyces sp. NRRL S-237]
MPDPSPSAPITLVLPDGQTIERVRLYEREQLDTGLWMYRIGVPLWQTAVGGGVEPAEYSTWVTAAQLRPLPGVDLGRIPAHPRTRASAPARWAWLLDGRTQGRPATVHAEGCGNATDRAHPLGTMQALDALARPATTACTVCDAAEALLPILTHGNDSDPGGTQTVGDPL